MDFSKLFSFFENFPENFRFFQFRSISEKIFFGVEKKSWVQLRCKKLRSFDLWCFQRLPSTLTPSSKRLQNTRNKSTFSGKCCFKKKHSYIHIESVYALFWRKNLYMHFGFYMFLELIRVGSYWKVSEMNGNSIYWSKIAFGGACGALKRDYKKKQVSRRSISVKNNAICIWIQLLIYLQLWRPYRVYSRYIRKYRFSKISPCSDIFFEYPWNMT